VILQSWGRLQRPLSSCAVVPAGLSRNITIIEPRAALGRGLAYSTPFDEHLLNVPAGKMSALPGEPSHFLDWLRASRFPNAEPALFARERSMAKYLESVLDREVKRGRFTHVRAR